MSQSMTLDQLLDIFVEYKLGKLKKIVYGEREMTVDEFIILRMGELEAYYEASFNKEIAEFVRWHDEPAATFINYYLTLKKESR